MSRLANRIAEPAPEVQNSLSRSACFSSKCPIHIENTVELSLKLSKLKELTDSSSKPSKLGNDQFLQTINNINSNIHDIQKKIIDQDEKQNIAAIDFEALSTSLSELSRTVSENTAIINQTVDLITYHNIKLREIEELLSTWTLAS